MTARRAAALAAAAGLSISLPTLGNGFAIDDGWRIVDKPAIQSLGEIPGFFAGSWGVGSQDRYIGAMSRRYYRPLAMTLSALEYAAFGLRPWGYHLVSGALHAVTAALVAFLIARVSRSGTAALVGGLYFAVHPAQAESIAAASYQTTLLAGLLGTAALVLFGRVLEQGPRPATLVSMGAALLGACMSKEEAFAVPLLAAAWAVLLRPPGWRRALWAGGAVLAGAAAVVLAVRAATLGVSPLTYFGDAPRATVILTMVRVAALYAEIIVVPLRLCPFYDWFIIPPEEGVSTRVVAGGAVILGAVLAIVVAARRRPPLALGLAWALLALGPVSQVIPIIVVAAERFLYLPLCGLSLAFGILAAAAIERARAVGRMPVAAAVVGVVLAAYAGRTLVRLPDWRDDGTLNRATAAAFPETPTPLLNLAEFHESKGDLPAAVHALGEAARRAPGWKVPAERLAGLRRRHPEPSAMVTP